MKKKIDLVMWAYNGGWVLPRCLDSINKSIPESVINQKIIVDDNSTDNTREIGEKFGWTIVRNKGKGIGDGANTALSLVETEMYASFEQDIILHKDWWYRVSKIIDKPKVAAAQGTRVPDKPIIREIQLYRLKHHPATKSIDNTLYKTDIIRDIGGYSTLEGAAVDTHVVHKIWEKGYKWLVDPTLISNHIRKGVRAEIKTYYWYGKSGARSLSKKYPGFYNIRTFAKGVFTSFPTSFKMVLEMKCLPILFVYPLIRINSFKGFRDSLRENSDV
ncbi:MAG: glycosyltransferase [Candidatus Ranarchaeia archaeon]